MRWRFELCDKLSLKSPVEWNGTGVASELFRKPGGGSTALSKQALPPKDRDWRGGVAFVIVLDEILESREFRLAVVALASRLGFS